MPDLDLSTGPLLASLVVSSVGFSLFLYGKKQVRFPQLIVGLALMIYPYFGVGPVAMCSIASALILALVLAVRMGH